MDHPCAYKFSLCIQVSRRQSSVRPEQSSPAETQEEALGLMLQHLEEKFLSPECWWRVRSKSRTGVGVLREGARGRVSDREWMQTVQQWAVCGDSSVTCSRTWAQQPHSLQHFLAVAAIILASRQPQHLSTVLPLYCQQLPSTVFIHYSKAFKKI